MFAIGDRVKVAVHHGGGQWTDHGTGKVLAVSEGVNSVYTVQLDSGGVPRVFGYKHVSADKQRAPDPAKIMADPATSYWLKRALEEALPRDPLDAARDAELLGRVLRQRANDVLGLHGLVA